MKRSLLAIILVIAMIGTIACSAGAEDVNVLELINQANQNENLRKNHETAAFRFAEYDADGNVYSMYNYLDQNLIAYENEGNVTIFENGIFYGFDDVEKRLFAEIYLEDFTEDDIVPISGFSWSEEEVVIETYEENDKLVVHTQSTEERLPYILETLGYEYEGDAVAFNEYILDRETYEILESTLLASIPGIDGNVVLSELTRVAHPDAYDTADEVRALVFPEDNLRTVIITADPDTENETVYRMEIGKGCIVRVIMSSDYPYLYTDRACTQRYEGNGEDYDSDMILFTKAEQYVFAYEHDPRLNPSAMADIVENPDAVYGFSPNPESSRLGTYAAYDWTDPEVVEQGRLDRLAYHESLYTMYDILHEMRDSGSTIEEMARAVSAERNRLRLESYHDDPDGLAKVKQSNLETYGDENGPTADSLFEKYGSWETVLQKAFSTNAGMDACVGLYDSFYTLYIELGMVQE